MKILYSELFGVEIPQDSTLSRINIKLNSNLKSVKLLGLEAFNAEVFSVSPKGKAVVSAALFKKAFLVLNINGADNVQLPLANLKRAQSNTAGDTWTVQFTEFTGQVIDWEKSYIQFGAPQDTAALADTEFVFLAHYTK